MGLSRPDRARFAGGVFGSREAAETWIAKHSLSGVLTPKKPHETEPAFIGGFTTASQPHDHYVNGGPA